MKGELQSPITCKPQSQIRSTTARFSFQTCVKLVIRAQEPCPTVSALHTQIQTENRPYLCKDCHFPSFELCLWKLSYVISYCSTSWHMFIFLCFLLSSTLTLSLSLYWARVKIRSKNPIQFCSYIVITYFKCWDMPISSVMFLYEPEVCYFN